MSDKTIIKISLNTAIAENILKYAATFKNINKFVATRYNKENKYIVDLKLCYGKTRIKYKKKFIYINYKRENKTVGTYNGPDKFEELVLTCDSNKKFLQNFIEAARKHCIPNKKDCINCYIMKNSFWHILSKLPKRSLETIYLDSNVKQDLLSDITEFRESKEKYEEFGIPYKRIYLLEGLPGTGKTSLIFAIASEINYNVAIINFGADVDDYLFMNSLSNIPNNCILILEDIDKLFNNRDNTTALTFSGMLNSLDGLGRKDNLIIFITTNHREKLDSALVRPGRIDKEIHFGYATENQVRQIYNKLAKKHIDKLDKFIQLTKNINLTVAILSKYLFYYSNKDDDLIIKNTKELENMAKDYNKQSNMLYM